MWNRDAIELLKKLWIDGQSAAQIAAQVGNSRSAVCAKLQRLGLKRGHNPPTAKPKIVSERRRTKRRHAASQSASADRLSSAPLRPLQRVIPPRPKGTPVEFSKSQLREVLTNAVKNTG
jgi:GcrA cell cycle regulator